MISPKHIDICNMDMLSYFRVKNG